ncbi:MAG TPA: hypothetical protein VNI35_00410, partial [Nitrospira sp.]|nr:hypothetical protein [Nitrospira sp.]
MEAVGEEMLQTTRRLNDGTQQHVISTDLNGQGSIPPTTSGGITYTATTTTITWSWTGLQIQYGDLSLIAVPDGSRLVSGLANGTTYYFYPYYDTVLGQLIFVAISGTAAGTPPIAFTAPNANAAIIQNSDGKVALSNQAIAATATSGGSGGGGGSACKRWDMIVESRSRGLIRMGSLHEGEEIRTRSGWTKVSRRQMYESSTFIVLRLSNGEVVAVTPTDTLPLFGGGESLASDLTLRSVLVGIDKGGLIPLQITEIRLSKGAVRTILLSCDPDHEYMFGGYRPRVVGHNSRPIPK